MNITEVRITKIASDNMLAYASITIDNQFVVTGLKVINGKNGYFVAMPSRKVGEEYKDIVFPITKEAREYIQASVLQEYEKGGSNEHVHKEIEKKMPKLDDIDSEMLPF